MTFAPGRVIAGALVTVVERRYALARSLAIPFALYVAIDLLVAELPASVRWLYIPLGLCIHTVFALNTHRTILLGSQSVPRWGLRLWNKREWRFAGHIVAVAVCVMPAALPALIPYVGPLMMIGIAAWMISRLSLIFPAIAIDAETRLSDAWDMSGNHQWPLVVSIGLFPIGLAVAGGLILIPVIAISEGGVIVTVLSTVVEMLTNVFAIAALSLAYNEVRRLETPVPAGELQ